MSHIIQKFADWTKVNEDDLPGRERERGDKNNKIVAIPVDKSTLKLKIVNDADIIDGNGRVTIDGFDALLTWIKSQGEIISYYSALNDLTNNVVVYEIGKDTDRKQVVIFKIYNKNALKMQDPSQPGINSQVRFVSSRELSQALGGAILNTKAIANIVSGQPKGSTAAGFTLPYPIASMLDSSDPKVVGFVTNAYNKILKEPRAKTAPLMVKVRAEVGAMKLGPASQLFVKALNAGFAIVDNRFADEIEADDITQTLVDKISYTAESRGFYLDLSATRIVESESDVIKGFDVDVFLLAAKNVPGVTTTGDIKVPELGFKYGIKGDAEFAKFQQVLLTNLPIYQGGALKAVGHVSAFLKTKADGIYGDKTKNVIGFLKRGLDNPKYPDNDGTTIKPDFVNYMMKEFKLIKESRTYLGLDGVTIIMEGFDIGAATADGGGGGTVTRKVVNQNTQNNNNNNNSAASPKGVYGLENYPTWEYKLVNDVWYKKLKTSGQGAWTINLNKDTIQELIARYRIGYFIRLSMKPDKTWIRANDYLYRFAHASKKWEVKISGIWQESNEGKVLSSIYGSEPLKVRVGGASAPKPTARKLSDDAIKGYAHTLFLAMDGANTYEDEIYAVYRNIKTYADLAALNNMFTKEKGVGGQSLAYWLDDDLDHLEFQKVFDILRSNGLMTKEALLSLENKVLKQSDRTDTTAYKNAYAALASTAIAKSK
jgi:hypothetical protein